MPRVLKLQVWVTATTAFCLAGCSTAAAGCNSSAPAITDGFAITVTGLPQTSEDVTVTACFAHDCRHTTIPSHGRRAIALIEHPLSNTTAPVTVTVEADHGKQPVARQLTRTLTPRYIASQDTRCHPDQHLVELTLVATPTG